MCHKTPEKYKPVSTIQAFNFLEGFQKIFTDQIPQKSGRSDSHSMGLAAQMAQKLGLNAEGEFHRIFPFGEKSQGLEKTGHDRFDIMAAIIRHAGTKIR